MDEAGVFGVHCSTFPIANFFTSLSGYLHLIISDLKKTQKQAPEILKYAAVLYTERPKRRLHRFTQMHCREDILLAQYKQPDTNVGRP